MKSKIAAVLLVAFFLVGCDRGTSGERIFDEGLLNQWGYQTSNGHGGGEWHSIRSKKNYGNAEEAFYARFTLKKSSFASVEKAAAAMAEIEEKRLSTVLGRDKDYRRIIQHGKELYFVTATSNYTRLSHQPALMKQIAEHLKASTP